MKRKSFAIALLGALAGLSSCSEEEELSSLAPTQNGVQINAEIVGYEDPTHARTVIDNEGKVKWEEGDVLKITYTCDSWFRGAVVKDINYQSGRFQAGETGIFKETAGEKNYLMASNIQDPYFWISNDGNNPSEVTCFKSEYPFALPDAIQDDNLPGKGIGKRDILTGFTTMIPTGENDVVNLKMKHLLSLLKFNIVNKTGQPFTVMEYSLKTPEGTYINGKVQPTYVADGQGNFVFNEEQTYSADGSNPSNKMYLSIKNAKPIESEKSYEVGLLTIPFKLTSGQQIEIMVGNTTGVFTHTYTVDKELEFKAGALSTATIVVDQMELYDENNVYIPSPKFRDFLIQNYDNDHNNKLSKRELEEIKKLELYNEKIPSLEGIENLTNLDSLILRESDPIEADLTKNAKLTYVKFYGDTQASNLNIKDLTSLKSILIESTEWNQPLFKGMDFREITNLESLTLKNLNLSSLDLTGLNKLKELKIDHLPNLALEDILVNKNVEKLTIGYSKETSLNVSAFSHLKYLKITDNENLSQLNFSGCTELTYLYILDCKQLQNVDISAATQLQKIKIWHTGITGINLSQCKELPYVNLSYNDNLGSLDLSGLSKLEQLFAEKCQLTSLKLSGCSSLSTLRVKGNNLAELDVSDCHHDLGKDNDHKFSLIYNTNFKTLYVWEGFTKRRGCDFPTDLKPTVKKQTTTPDTPVQ